MNETFRLRRLRPALEATLVACLAAAPYLGVKDAPFVFDDVKLVRDNETIRDFSRIPATFNIFSRRWDDEELRANYRPLRFLSYAVDYRITRWIHGDFKPEALPTRVFHIHNILLHALNALLILGIARLLLGDRPAALLLALLFAVHPILTEAVSYVSGRRDVLSTFFFLAALRVYLGRAGPPAAAPGRDDLPRAAPLTTTALIAVPVLFVLALLSKEMAVTLPAVILLIDLARRARFEPRRAALIAVLSGLALAFTVHEATNPRLVAGAPGGSRASALLTAPRYLARHLSLLLIPYPQSIDYSFDAIPVSRSPLDPWTTIPSALLVLGLAAGGLISIRRRRFALPVGILWFAGTLTPVLQIVPIPERFAERFVYLPAIGIFLALAAVFRDLRRRWPLPAHGAAAAAVVVLASLAVIRNADWKWPEDLWGSAARAQPRSARAHLGYADALRDARRLRDAAREYGLCLEVLGDEPPAALAAGEPLRARSDELLRWGQVLQARVFRAEVLLKLGEGHEGLENYQKAAQDYRWILRQRDIDGTPIDRSPRYLVTHFNLGNCLLGLAGSESAPDRARCLRDEAAEEFRRVATGGGDPGLARAARYQLSKIALLEGRKDDALKELEEAFRIARESGDRMDRYALVGELSDLLVARKEDGRADDLLRASVAELGDLPDRKHLLYRRSQIADRHGDLTGAIRILEDILEIDPRYGPALLTLAGMEENRGNLDRAEGLYRRVLVEAPGEARAAQGLRSIQVRRTMKEEGKEAPGEDESEKTRVLLEGLLKRGEGHLEKGQLLAAMELYHHAADDAAAAPDPRRFAPQRSRALRGLASVARGLREFPRAKEYLREAWSVDPGSRDALRDLADLELRDLHDRKGAEAAYQEYLDTFPEGEMAEGWVYVNLASLIQDRRPSRAIDLYQAAKKAGFKNPQVARRIDRSLGYLLAQVGRFEEALERFEVYLERSGAEAPEDPVEARDREEARRYVRDEVLPRLEGGEDLPGKGEPPHGAAPGPEEPGKSP